MHRATSATQPGKRHNYDPAGRDALGRQRCNGAADSSSLNATRCAATGTQTYGAPRHGEAAATTRACRSERTTRGRGCQERRSCQRERSTGGTDRTAPCRARRPAAPRATNPKRGCRARLQRNRRSGLASTAAGTWDPGVGDVKWAVHRAIVAWALETNRGRAMRGFFGILLAAGAAFALGGIACTAANRSMRCGYSPPAAASTRSATASTPPGSPLPYSPSTRPARHRRNDSTTAATSCRLPAGSSSAITSPRSPAPGH